MSLGTDCRSGKQREEGRKERTGKSFVIKAPALQDHFEASVNDVGGAQVLPTESDKQRKKRTPTGIIQRLAMTKSFVQKDVLRKCKDANQASEKATAIRAMIMIAGIFGTRSPFLALSDGSVAGSAAPSVTPLSVMPLFCSNQ